MKIQNAKPPPILKQLESFVGITFCHGQMVRHLAIKFVTFEQNSKR